MGDVSALVGTASDECPEILATGRTDVTTIYTSLSKRHPEGLDADYLEWHSLDHRPEQHRLAQLRASFRMVSTPACRAARAASHERYDEADHLQTYFFTDLSAMDRFNELNTALRNAGRAPYLLPLVERGVYRVDGIAAAPRIKVGADVLLWWSAKGVYFMIERGGDAVANLLDVPGVGGAWWGGAEPLEPPFTTRDNFRPSCQLSLPRRRTRRGGRAPSTSTRAALVDIGQRATPRRSLPQPGRLRVGPLPALISDGAGKSAPTAERPRRLPDGR